MISIYVKNVYKSYLHQEQKTLKDFFQSVVTSKTPKNHRVEALSNVSFSITKGESVGIIGKNGAGKTTLLKLISKVSAPSHGTIRVKGKVVPLLGLGAGFHPRLTARENIFLNAAILGMNEKYVLSVYEKIVHFAEIKPELLETPIRYFSSGMYSRLAFSVSVFVKPDILILDEVFSVGDISFKKKSEQKVMEIINSGVTCLFVSHSPESIEKVCTRVLYLKNGELVFDGPVSEGLEYYSNDIKLENSK